METKFTKGKWGLLDKSSNGILPKEDAFAVIENTYEWDICAVWKDCEYIETAKANALLISKAPEMFEMLEKWSILNPEHYKDLAGFINETKQLLKEATEL